MLYWNAFREMARISRLYIILIMLRGRKLFAILGYMRSVCSIVVGMTSFKLQRPIRKQCASHVEIDMPRFEVAFVLRCRLPCTHHAI
jgi:hypothetical protein